MGGVIVKTQLRHRVGFAAHVIDVEIRCPHHRQAMEVQVMEGLAPSGEEWADEELQRWAVTALAQTMLRCAPCDCARAVWARSWPILGRPCVVSRN